MPLAARLPDATTSASHANEKAALSVPFIPSTLVPEIERMPYRYSRTTLLTKVRGTKSW